MAKTSAKDYLRQKFATGNRFSLADLTDGGTYTEVTIKTSISDLKNPKYSAGPTMIIEREGNEYVLRTDDDDDDDGIPTTDVEVIDLGGGRYQIGNIIVETGNSELSVSSAVGTEEHNSENTETGSTNSAKFHDMPCTQAIQNFIDTQEWTDEIEVKEDRTFGRLATSLTLNEHSCRLYIEAEETEERIYVYLYFPIKTPPTRMPEVARLLNRVNAPMKLGRLACFDDNEANSIQYKATIDVEDSTVVGDQIASMLIPGRNTFLRYWDLLTAACLTKQNADALWANFLEEEAAKEEQKNARTTDNVDGGGGPTAL